MAVRKTATTAAASKEEQMLTTDFDANATQFDTDKFKGSFLASSLKPENQGIQDPHHRSVRAKQEYCKFAFRPGNQIGGINGGTDTAVDLINSNNEAKSEVIAKTEE